MVARRSPKPQAGVRLPTRLPRGLAQSGSALALGARGRRFESCIPDQLGELAEWSIATVLKTVEHESVPWVRIPHSPPLCERGGMVTQRIANPCMRVRFSPLTPI